MDGEELLAAVHRLAWSSTDELRCAVLGHAAGHVCLPVSEGTSLSTLLHAVSSWYGQPRALVVDGHLAPTATERAGLPLLAPFGEDLVEIHAWACRSRWIGCGTTRTGNGPRPMVLVAERANPAADGLPEGDSWVDMIVAVTGWDRNPAHPVDWPAVESRLGTALPDDYKRLAELFGHGAFDAFLRFSVPDPEAPSKSSDMVRHTEWLAQWAAEHGTRLWTPYEPFPAQGGLLQWADSEQAHEFYWLTEGSDPGKWPVLWTEHDVRSWDRFNGSTAEFIYRMLTDQQHPLSTLASFDAHWFMPFQSDESFVPGAG